MKSKGLLWFLKFKLWTLKNFKIYVHCLQYKRVTINVINEAQQIRSKNKEVITKIVTTLTICKLDMDVLTIVIKYRYATLEKKITILSPKNFNPPKVTNHVLYLWKGQQYYKLSLRGVKSPILIVREEGGGRLIPFLSNQWTKDEIWILKFSNTPVFICALHIRV